jgi:hypothetical protein
MNTEFICSIREYLEVSETLRAIESSYCERKPIEKKERENQKWLENMRMADTWARQRAGELQEKGISAEACRVRKNQALCVCY